MDLGIREAAGLLGVSEKTVHRWIRSEGLPAQRVHHQYRINRFELHEWALAHGHRASADVLGGRGDGASLASALERGGVHRNVPGERREQVLEALVQLPTVPRGVNRRLLFDLLVARDAFVLSGVAGGMALPHPRDPVVLRGQEPLALLGYLEHPVRYSPAQAVSSVLLLFAPSVPVFLGLLGKLAHAFADERVRGLLSSQHPGETIVERIRALARESTA